MTESLNPEQKAAVEHGKGPAVVLAGPGAGKTGCIAERYAYLLRHGQRSDRILCTTFSVEAACEMRARIVKLTGLSLQTLKESVLTFHALAFRIIRAEREHLGWKLFHPMLVEVSESQKIIRDLVRSDMRPALKRYIGVQRRNLVTPQQAFENANGSNELLLANAYLNYDEALREIGKVDFDSMVYWAVKVLMPQSIRAIYDYVIVDESHDASHDQCRLAEMLAIPGNNLLIVGDSSQAIYGFRNGTSDFLLSDSENRKKYFLGANYRSGSEIIEAFKPFAEQDSLSQELVSKMRSKREYEGAVVIWGCTDSYAEARDVVSAIKSTTVSWNDYAILARTRAALLPFAETLEDNNIPYRWRGNNFWLSSEIQDAIAFCKFSLDSMDYKSFVRIVSSQASVVKFLGKKFAESIVREAKDGECSPLDIDAPEGTAEFKIERWDDARDVLACLGACKLYAPADFLRELQRSAGLSFYDSENPDDFSSENFEALCLRAARFDTLQSFVEHADKMAAQVRSGEGVTLATKHSSKGLEWANVFCVGWTEGKFPHWRSEDVNEERRLAYVALSRARDFLWVSWHGKQSEFINMIPERFRKVAENVESKSA